MIKADRILVLAAHPDDEFGCAGTIHRLLGEGSEVWYTALSGCEDSIPEDGPLPQDIRRVEGHECMVRLGVHPDKIQILNFPLRRFPEHRQEILEVMLGLRESVRPDLVMVPSSRDKHQDHQVVAAEGFRAFKHRTLLGYVLPQNIVFFENSMFVELDEEAMRAKLHALAAHRSQSHKPYAQEEFIRGFCRTCGVQAGVTYAEAFETVKAVWR